MSFDHIKHQDPAVYEAMMKELERQRTYIELIASENFVSPAVMEAMGSHLTNKYAEGYPGARYYGGCSFVDEVERLAIDRALKLFGAEHANVQPHSGSQANAAVYLALLKPGDTIVFDSVSRMSRNAEEGFSDYKQLFHADVTLVFLKEPAINTDTYKEALTRQVPMTGGDVDLILEGVNKFLLKLAEIQIRIAFEQAEKEVQDLHRRTSEGLVTAKLQGKRVGTPKGTTFETKKAVAAKKKMLEVCRDFGGTLSDKDAMKVVGVASNTFYKYKRELKGRCPDIIQ